MMPHSPTTIRTCVACRVKKTRGQMVRFVADERGHVRPDPGQRSAGRGVYTCPALACVERAAERGGFARGLRRRVAKVSGVELARRVICAANEERRGLLARGRLDGRVVRTSDAVEEGAALCEVDGNRWVPRDPRLVQQVAMLAEQVHRLEA